MHNSYTHGECWLFLSRRGSGEIVHGFVKVEEVPVSPEQCEDLIVQVLWHYSNVLQAWQTSSGGIAGVQLWREGGRGVNQVSESIRGRGSL